LVEPADAKELIDEAIEEVERVDKEERALEKRFRDRVSILVGLFAVLLAIIHVAAASNARESLLKTVNASDTYNYMEAKIIRESLLKGLAQVPGLDTVTHQAMLKEASRLRNPDRAGHGIVQLQEKADELRSDGESSARRGEWYELAETAMQVGIVLLSIALVARSWAIVSGAVLLAGMGILLAAGTAAGFLS
jgi:hypothetical protein